MTPEQQNLKDIVVMFDEYKARNGVYPSTVSLPARWHSKELEQWCKANNMTVEYKSSGYTPQQIPG